MQQLLIAEVASAQAYAVAHACSNSAILSSRKNLFRQRKAEYGFDHHISVSSMSHQTRHVIAVAKECGEVYGRSAVVNSAAVQCLTSPGRVLAGGCYAIVCPKNTIRSKNLCYLHERSLHDARVRHRSTSFAERHCMQL